LKEQQRRLREQANTWRTEGDKERRAGEAIAARATRATPPSTTLTPELETQIRAAATAAGLDPETAVQRARQRQ
jgi:hypothetical protein